MLRGDRRSGWNNIYDVYDTMARMDWMVYTNDPRSLNEFDIQRCVINISTVRIFVCSTGERPFSSKKAF